MIPANPTRLGRFFWESFSALSIRLRFRDIFLEGETAVDPDRSLLLIGNHISWWDGFWPLHLNKLHFGKAYYVMMLEEQLAQRPFMRQGGAFSIDPGSRSIVQSLRYAAELLSNPKNMVLVFPQGKIHSMHDTDFEFQPGIGRLLQLSKHPVQVLMYVVLPDFFSHPKPALFFYVKSCPSEIAQDGPQFQQYFQEFYAACVERQKLRVGE